MLNQEVFQDTLTEFSHIFQGDLPSSHVSTVTLPTSEAISIVIPTLNEAENIGHLLVRLHQVLMKAAIPYEAIIVDDRSADDTIDVARAIARDKGLPVRILTKHGTPGKAYSLVEGFAAAQFDLLAMIDGDLQYPPEALPEMIRAIEHSDIIIADRRTTYQEADRTRGRLSHVFTSIITMLFGIDTDMQSGLKVFRRAIYDNGARACSGKWNLDLYLVTHAVFNGHKLKNIPIEFRERQAGKSKVLPLKVGLELLRTALQIKARRIARSVLGKRQLHTGNTPIFGKKKTTKLLQNFPTKDTELDLTRL